MPENDDSWLQEDDSWRKTTGHGASQPAFKPSGIKGVFLFKQIASGYLKI
jgi:hypothetical protein